jgi:hypothetical protein
MRQDGRLAGYLLRVRESFEERKNRFAFKFEIHGSGEVLGEFCLGLYIPGREAGSGSLPCHLCLPSTFVFAT